jgi:hypothetical protein
LEQLDIQSVIRGSDSLELIQACNAEVEVWSRSAAILEECFMKAHGFTLILYRHHSREANQIAHELGRNSFGTNSVLRWSDVPQILFSLLYLMM